LLLGFTLVGFSQTAGIPDPNFEHALKDLGFNISPISGSVSTAIDSGVTLLEVSNKNISSLIGIEAFTSLNYLSCYENQLTSLDLSYIITDIQ